MTTDRPAWIRRVRAIVTGDKTETGSYRLTTEDGQPDERDHATAAALMAETLYGHDYSEDDYQAARATIAYNNRQIANAFGGTNMTSLYPGDDTPMDAADEARRAVLPRRDPGSHLPLELVDIPDDLIEATQPDDTLPPAYPAPPADDRPVNDLLGLDKPHPVEDSGIHHLPDPDPATTTKVTCTHCGGTGYTMRTVSELLRESIALIPADGGQAVIREFYRRLLTAAPTLAPLFPADLITAATDDLASPGRMQRDKLLQALAALADLYGTSRADRTRLDTALRAMGRSHAAFARPDGTTRGATFGEYRAVFNVLIATLHSAAGDAWLPEYDTAWAEAYDHAADVMLAEQHTSGMEMARYPRTPL